MNKPETSPMNRKILVIEDDPKALRFTRYTLEQEGFQVVTAANGLEGLRKAQMEAPDLIILDVMLPGIDGFEVCHRLRAEPQTAQLPILMISAKAQEVDKATGLKVGADDYVTKPVGPAEIVSRVEALLARKAVAWSIIEVAQQIIAQEKERGQR
jgi:two-component system alkaline phosphatase synthesis response regulator PhoP